MFETGNGMDQLGNGIYEDTTYLVQLKYRATNGSWFSLDQSSCSVGGPYQPDYKCVDGGTNAIRGYTFE